MNLNTDKDNITPVEWLSKALVDAGILVLGSSYLSIRSVYTGRMSMDSALPCVVTEGCEFTFPDLYAHFMRGNLEVFYLTRAPVPVSVVKTMIDSGGKPTEVPTYRWTTTEELHSNVLILDDFINNQMRAGWECRSAVNYTGEFESPDRFRYHVTAVSDGNTKNHKALFEYVGKG